MQRRNFFLRTKLLQPRSISDLLERPRLVDKLKANLNSPITMVAADAGCGKTTLVADFLRQRERPSVWYQLDHTDADPFVFLGYITEGIRTFAPEFGETIFPYLAEAGEELLKFPERAADLLLNEIFEQIEQPFILVLDDYHHIGRETIVHTIVDRLVQYSSEMLHVIITTRDLPPLAITRRKTQLSALIITREDLLFTDSEVRDLFRKTLGLEFEEQELADYRERTNGWITALQLVRQVAEQSMGRDQGDKPDLKDVLDRSERDIFDYFAEEVFARETETTQEMLLKLSLLDSMPLDVCSRLFPDMRCSAQLPLLAQKNVFLTVAGDAGKEEVYRFHPLFKDFLVRRLRSEIGHGKLAAERSKIADFFLAANQFEAALPFLLDAENYDQAAKVISETGAEWLASGAFVSLGLFADRIPDESLEKFPRSLLYKAEIARLQGSIDRAVTLLHRAVKLMEAADDAAGEGEALHSLASLARRRGKFAEAFELLARSEKLVAEDSETFLKCSNTRGLCLIAEGNWAEAEQQFRFALELAERLSNEHYIRIVTHNLALAPGFRGDFGEALRWFKRIFREDEPDKQLPQEAIGHLNVARLHLYRGEFDDTEKHLQRSLELCQLYNLRALTGEVFEAFGNFYREKGDLTHASEYYERAAKSYDEAEVDTSFREIDEERARFAVLSGDLIAARQLLTNLIETRVRLKNTVGIYTAKSLLARVKLLSGDTPDLLHEIGEVLNYFHSNQHYYEEAMASLLLAETHFALGNASKAIEPIQRVLDLVARFDYEFWLGREIKRNVELFRNDEIRERLPADLRRLVDAPVRATPAAADAPVIVAASVTDLTINVLGPVEIHRDPSLPFAADAWTTRRARDIFCFIATSKHRRVQKDVLIDTFWPDEEPDVVEKNFHPTISHIRKALNSHQAFKQNFLVFRDGAYQLNPEMSYSIDSENFELMIAEAEVAKREKDGILLREKLEAAYALYRGEYMSGVYDEWAVDRRHYYSEQFARALAALAKLSFAERKWNAVGKFAGEIIESDPYREDMHRLMMKVYAAQGNSAAVKDQFDSLRGLLKDELGIEPAVETRRLVKELLG